LSAVLPSAASSDLERAAPPVLECLRGLRCTVAVAQHGSAMAAGVAVHLSQPAVTRAILELERLLGTPLFTRGARGMVPTAEGARVAQRAGVLCEHLARGAADALASSPEPRRRSRDAEARRFAAAVVPASLRALVAVAGTRSATRAAALLGLSQPAVHHALRLLEDLAGVPLFQKSARGTLFTHAGEALLHRVKLALAEARAIGAEASAWQGDLRGRLVVGVLPLSVTVLLPQAIEAVLQQHPGVEIVALDGTTESLLPRLLGADLDIVVGALRPGAPLPGLRQEALFDDALAVVATRGHPCLDGRALELADLLRWPWVLPLPGTPASLALQRIFVARDLAPPQGRVHAGNTAILRALMRAGDRLAITSRGEALQEARLGAIGVVPVPLPDTSRRVGMLLRDAPALPPDLQALVEALRLSAAGLREAGS
jgi:LysR family transcriptional regulator of gallate degradation